MTGKITMKTTMKTTRILKGLFAATLAGVVAFTAVPANAAHELLLGVDQFDNLFSFYSDAPGNLLSQRAITGLQNNESIVGIDSWNGAVYGLGNSSRLYTLDLNTGNATQVGSGPFATLLSGITFGVDNGASGVQVVSGLGQSLLVDRSTGVATAEPSVSYAAGDIYEGQGPRVDALAFDPVSGKWLAADTLKNSLATFDPVTGLLNTIGALGIDAARGNGMDVSPDTGIMYMDTPQASSDPQANLYTVNKLTGQVSLVGLIGNPGDNILVSGLTVVPEPSTVALLALGAVGLLFARRRE
jgi:hypothetical protein